MVCIHKIDLEKQKTKTSSQVTQVPALDTCHVLLMPTVARMIVPHFLTKTYFPTISKREETKQIRVLINKTTQRSPFESADVQGATPVMFC